MTANLPANHGPFAQNSKKSDQISEFDVLINTSIAFLKLSYITFSGLKPPRLWPVGPPRTSASVLQNADYWGVRRVRRPAQDAAARPAY